MVKIKCLIIDDSPLIAESLSDLLRAEHPEMQLLGFAPDGQLGLELIRKHEPDLIFLDVEMPKLNGFEMLAKLAQINFQTIFITSFSKYAISAIRFNALDYLLKPIDPVQLKNAIDRFEMSHDSKLNQLRIEEALKNLKKKDISEQSLILATQEGELRLKLKEIIRLEGDRNYSHLILSGRKTVLSSKNLLYFEERLVDKGFFRCHQSHLVNKLHVDKLKGDCFQMKDGEMVSVSRRKKAEAKTWLNGSTDIS